MKLVERLLALSDAVRYASTLRDGDLATRAKPDRAGASGEESDRYEELLVNPTLLTLAGRRGDIDCGGLTYLIIRYGHFFQIVVPTTWGHASVCVEADADPVALAEEVLRAVAGSA